MTTLRIRLEIDPASVSVNEKVGKTRAGNPGNTPRYKAGLDAITYQVRQAVVKQGWRPRSGQCRATIVTNWPTHLGDVDSTSKAVLDALQYGNAVVNDKQIHPVLLDFTHRNREGSIDVELVEVE